MCSVDDRERLVTENFETTGHPHFCEPLVHDVLRERRREECFDGREGYGSISTLMGPVQREVDVGVDGRRRP